jgi:hypothetical protein
LELNTASDVLPRLAQKGDVIALIRRRWHYAPETETHAWLWVWQICCDLERLLRCSSFHFAVLESRARAQPNKVADQIRAGIQNGSSASLHISSSESSKRIYFIDLLDHAMIELVKNSKLLRCVPKSKSNNSRLNADVKKKEGEEKRGGRREASYNHTTGLRVSYVLMLKS